MSRPVLQADDREPADGLVVVGGREPVEHRAQRVHRAGGVAGEKLERDQSRAAAGRALVVEPATEELDLLAKAKLPDGPVGDRPLAVVGAARGTLDLVLPLPAQIGQLALGTFLGERVRLGSCVGERAQEAEPPLSDRGGGPT